MTSLPIFPPTSVLSAFNTDLLTLNLPTKITQHPSFSLHHLLLLDTYIVKKYLLEHNESLEEFIHILYEEMQACVREGRFVASDESQFPRIDAFNEKSIMKVGENSDALPPVPHFHFLHCLEVFMKVLNWFNREKEESKSDSRARTLFVEFVAHEEVRREILRHFDGSIADNAVANGSTHNSTLLSRVYEILSYTKSFHLLKVFSEVEEEFMRGMQVEDFFEQPTQQHSASTSAVFHQNAFLYYSFLRRQNPLQIIFTASLSAIQERQFSKLNLLLEPPIFHPLKALIFTVAWDLLDSDVLLLTYIYHILFPSDNHPEPRLSGDESHSSTSQQFSHDPALNYACHFLNYILKLSDWILNHSSISNEHIDYQAYEKVFGKDATRQLHEGALEAHHIAQLAVKKIRTHSLLYILTPWIKKMPPTTLTQFIVNFPRIGEDTNVTNTLDSVHTYQSVRSLMNLVMEPTLDSDSLASSIASLQKTIENISEPTRLTVLRDIINYLFVTHAESQSKRRRHPEVALKGSHEIVEAVLRLCEGVLRKTSTNDQDFHHTLTQHVQELLWRIETWNKLTAAQTTSPDNRTFENFLLTSPDSLLITALQNDNLQLAHIIFERYQSNVSDAARNEFLATTLLNDSRRSGELPSETNALLDCLFTGEKKDQILKQLQEHTVHSWLKRLHIAMDKANIPPEDFAFISDSLLQLPEDQLEQLISARQRISRDNLSDIVSLAHAHETDFTSAESLGQILSLFRELCTRSGVLPKFLQYLFETIQKGKHSSVASLLNVFPQTLVEKSAFLDRDFETAASLADMYSIDLWKVVVASFAQQTVPDGHLTAEMLEYFHQKSNIIGLMARILLDAPQSDEQWRTIESLCHEHCPQAKDWINAQKHALEIQRDMLNRRVTTELSSFAQVTQQLTKLPLNKLIEITTNPDHPLNIHIHIQETAIDEEDPGTDSLPLPLLFRFANVKSVFSHFKQVFTTWSVEDCVDLLHYLLSSLYLALSKNRRRSRMKENPILLEVAAMLQKIIVMNQIAEACTEFHSWQHAFQALDDDPDALIEILLKTGRFDLAQSVLRASHGSVDPSLYHLVQSRQLLNMLCNDEQTQSINFLEDMLAEEALQACCKALDDTNDPPIQSFLCKYIITALKDELSPEMYQKYNDIFLTLQMLSLLEEELRSLFYDKLRTKPQLIIENLLLAGRIDEVALVLRQVPQLHDDHLLIAYGLKALAMKLSHQSKWELEWVWGEDEERDEHVRNNHFYDQAPSVVLSKRILDMVRESGRAGEGLLTICQEIARLSPSNFSSKYEHSQLVEQILHFAKLCFLRDADGHEFLPAIDTLQSRLELLKRIFNADCGIEVTLPDLGKQSKTRQIRDSLIEADQMELALDVATTCRIEREPVWIEWGLSLLSLGMHEEARDKLRHCTMLPHSQKQQLLMQIIQRLQMPSKVKHSQFLSSYSEYVQHQSQLRDVVEQLRAKLTKGEPIRTHPYLSKSVAWNANIDEVCFEEARFYCELFASPKDYLFFLTKHGRVVDAISYAVNNQVPQAVFVNAIIVHCHHHGLMDYLFESVANSHLKSQRQLIKPYWTAACKYFDQNGSIRLLYELQCFMKDEARSALTCIRMSLEDEHQHQIQLLTQAKSHFGKALQETMTRKKSILSAEEIANYMQTINLQMEILQNPALHQRLLEAKLSLFASERKRKKIAEIMLEESPPLAFRVINNYNLNAVKLYCRTLRSLALKKKNNEMESLLKQTLVTLSPQEKDTVVEHLIYVLVKEVKDIRSAEKHIGKLTSDSKMVRACLVCHKYKAAYVIATRASNKNKESDVREILNCLKQVGDSGKSGKLVLQHCENWMQKYVGTGSG